MKLRHRSDEEYTSAPPLPGGVGGGEWSRPDDERPPQGNAAPAILWSPEDDPLGPAGGRSVRCVLCAHRCLVREGRRGICGVRENRDGRLWSLVYGELVAAHLDPIEKKPLYHVLPGTTAYSIATMGCPFRCGFCQNWEIAQAPHEGLAPPTFQMTPEDVVATAVRSGASSIAYTYVEPTIFVEYLLDVARLARRAGLLNVLVTNGYLTPESIAEIAPWVDAANVDLKGFDDAVYRRVCGARLAPVLDTLVGLRAAGVWLEVTTLLIPGHTDDPDRLAQLTRWIARELGPETPWHVSRFFPAYRFGHVTATAVESVRTAARLGREAGLAHVYPGNLGSVAGAEDSVTRCAGCGETLLVRAGYQIVDDELLDGECAACGRHLAGILTRAALADRRAVVPAGGHDLGQTEVGR